MILGTINSYTAGAGVTVTIDGEDSPTTKEYMFLGSYTPSVGDRVLIEEISGTYVIIGKVAKSPSAVSYATSAGSATKATWADYVGNNGNYSSSTRIRFRVVSGKLSYLTGSYGWQNLKNE